MDRTPHRIVCLQPSATVILALLGKLDRVVACTKYCVDVCPGAAVGGRMIVEDSWTARAEQIMEANPDFVIAAVPYQEKAVIEILKSGIRFLGLAPKSLADIYTDIASISSLVDAAERGQLLIAQMEQEMTSIRAQIASERVQRVFCEEWGKPLIASQPWVAELVQAAGGEFVGKPGTQISSDAVLGADPDVLIAAWCGAGDRVPLEKIVRDRGWEKMRAVKQGRVYCVRDEYLNTPAPTLIEGLRALASALHPDRFPQAAGLRCIAAVTSAPVIT